MARLFPASASPDVPRIVAGRAIRGFADGFVSVLLARYLTALGFSPLQIGAIVTGTLIGSAVLTLGVGLSAHRRALRTLLLAACFLMAVTGLGFAAAQWFWPLLAIAVVGTLNPSAGDVSVFLPTEQAYVAGHVEPAERPHLYAVYNVAGSLAGALGALASAAPEPVSHALGWKEITGQRAGFLLYALAGAAILLLYRGLRDAGAPFPRVSGERRRALQSSRRIVLQLSALFSLDSAGGGLVVTSLLVLWLNLRFDMSPGATGTVFFAASLLAGFSQFVAGRLSARIGLIRTMVFTHLPANILLALAAFAPNAGIAVGLLLGRALLSQMDVPARQAFVMAVVPPEERAAAASVTNVPRSLAPAATAFLAGLLLSHSDFGWPLLIAGVAKATYDITLLIMFRDVPAEVAAPLGSPTT